MMIVDINLNSYQINGIDVIRQVRKFDNKIKIIVITAYATNEIRIEAFKAGSSYFVTKPYSMKDLKNILDS